MLNINNNVLIDLKIFLYTYIPKAQKITLKSLVFQKIRFLHKIQRDVLCKITINFLAHKNKNNPTITDKKLNA